MKQVCFFAFFALIFSAFRCADTICPACTPPPINIVNCQIVDKNGNDLLNPSSLGRFDTSKIQTFAVVNGQKTLRPRFFSVGSNPTQLAISIESVFTADDGQLLIQLDSSNAETLKYSIQLVAGECCSHSEFSKKSINGKDVDAKAVFSIVK
jgi:hypothetical protein